MNYKRLSLALGWFSIGLGALELVAAQPIARKLGAPSRKGIVQAFGARELVAGAGLLGAPAHAARVWGRVAGDAMDLAALGAAAAKAPRNGWIRGALAFVAAATAIDLIVARGLDKTTGKTAPARVGQLS